MSTQAKPTFHDLAVGEFGNDELWDASSEYREEGLEMLRKAAYLKNRGHGNKHEECLRESLQIEAKLRKLFHEATT